MPSCPGTDYGGSRLLRRTGNNRERLGPLEARRAQRSGDLLGARGEAAARETAEEVRVEQSRLELRKLVIGAQGRPDTGLLA
jgi:hypothetical protein